MNRSPYGMLIPQKLNPLCHSAGPSHVLYHTTGTKKLLGNGLLSSSLLDGCYPEGKGQMQARGCETEALVRNGSENSHPGELHGVPERTERRTTVRSRKPTCGLSPTKRFPRWLQWPELIWSKARTYSGSLMWVQDLRS